jgi:hypothetical protein
LRVLLQNLLLRHHAESSATMIADAMLTDLRPFHHALARQFDGISLRKQPAEQKKTIDVCLRQLLSTANLSVSAKEL